MKKCLRSHKYHSAQAEAVRVCGAGGNRTGYGDKLEDFVTAASVVFSRVAELTRRIIKHSDKAKGSVLPPRRWVVGRTFGQLIKARRLTRDYQRNPHHHGAFIYRAMISHSARRLITSKEWLQLVNGQALSTTVPITESGWASCFVSSWTPAAGRVEHADRLLQKQPAIPMQPAHHAFSISRAARPNSLRYSGRSHKVSVISL
jgi:hypothetical protein